MSIKTNLAPAPAHALGGFTLLTAAGPDTEAFLQAQLMNDVRALAPMQWQWNGWLSAKGRVIALFALLRLTPEQFWLVLPDFPAGELLPLLQRYVFRSKVKLAVTADWQAAADLDGNVSDDFSAASQIQGNEQLGYRLDFSGDDVARRLRLLPGNHPTLAPAEAATDQAWLAADIAHGLPRLDVGQREAWTPQMLSLDRLRAFSLKKGCYPGQEIVARTHYLGQAKRALARLEGHALTSGQEVSGPDGKIGSVISASGDGRHGLAVLPVGMDPASMLVTAAGPCLIQPLLTGLARPR